MKPVPPLNYQLRDYQNAFIGDVLKQIDNAGDNPSFLYAAPTGSGKSLMILTLHSFLPDNVVVTPRLEIVAGMLRQCGIDVSTWSTDKLAAEALEYRITTPLRLRNMLAAGTLPFRPTSIIWDEAHHRSADSYQDIRAYLGSGLLEVGLTASPFRGTPKGTEEFLAAWDSLTWILTYPQAAERGVIAVPRCEIWPLVDDDTIDVVNGEFVVSAAEGAAMSVVADVVLRCQQFHRARFAPPNDRGDDVVIGSQWDRPTIFAVSTTDTARQLAAALRNAALPAVAVTQDTPRQERAAVFAACERAEVAIVQIDVVSEGVDLKLRRLIDLRPTLSPVKWLQQIGRICRPTPAGEPPPEYICCCRNLERHCYLYDGLIPPAAVATAQQAFERPSARAGMRAVGVEGMGRFAAAQLPLADGTTGTMYNLTAVEGFRRTEYAVLLHPCSSQPLYATRENTKTAEGNVAWGKWQLAEKLPDLRGFQSAPPKTLSDKQRAWHARSAARYGLDPNGDINRRNFAALPILADLGLSLKGGA
jgi:superfamily II DNA or RNA helicase